MICKSLYDIGQVVQIQRTTGKCPTCQKTEPVEPFDEWVTIERVTFGLSETLYGFPNCSPKWESEIKQARTASPKGMDGEEVEHATA